MILRKERVNRSILRKISNVIIGFVITIFSIVAILFAFSQTSTFRNMLRKQILEISNNSLNGKLNIGEVKGTLITQLLLEDVSLTMDSDTLIALKKIEVALNPFYILAKTIKVTKFEINNAQINLLENKNKFWNIQKIIREDTTNIIAQVDSTIIEEAEQHKFPFIIDISDFELKNIHFVIKKYKYQKKNTNYDIINYDDIVINNLNLSLNILADINKNDYHINLKKLSLNPNLNRFVLHNLTGKINISENFAEIKNLSMLTDSSDVTLSAKLSKVNLFKPLSLIDLKKSPIKFNLATKRFCASDLNTFIAPLDFMYGAIAINLDGNGKFGNFDFSSELKIDKTNITINGNVTKLETPEFLYVKANFIDSDVEYEEIDDFLKGLELPKYPDLFVENINLKYEGEPLKFNLDGSASLDNGELTFTSFMDINPELIEYNYDITAKNINLKSTLGIECQLNANGKLSGHGFDPKKSSSNMDFVITNSTLEGHQIDSINAKLTTVDKIVDLTVFSGIDGMSANFLGKLDLASTKDPIYNLTGNFANLDIASYTKDTSITSSLNFTFDVNGHSLNIDKTEGNFELNFVDSRIGSNNFDSIHFNIDLSKINETRLISFNSDLLDFNITGDFSIAETFNLLKYQTKKIGYAVSQKIGKINPIVSESDSTAILSEIIAEKDDSQKELYLDYDFNFKDFKLIAALLNRDKVEISGKGYGYIENDSSNFSISTTMALDWLLLYKGKDVFYVSGIKSNFDIGSDNQEFSFDNIFGAFSLNSEKMVSSININDIKSDLVFNQSKAFVNLECNIEDDFDVGLEGILNFKDSSETLNISNLFFSFKDYLWENKDTIIVSNTPSLFNISNFNLYNGTSSLSLSGDIKNKLYQNFELELKNADGGIIGNRLFGSSSKELNWDINIAAKINGTTKKPIYDLNFSMNDLIVNRRNLGSLYGKIKYDNRNLLTNIEFINSRSTTNKKLLSLNGNIPINLDSETIEYDSTSDKSMFLEFITNNFSLASLGDIIPTIKNPMGLINSNIKLTGSFSDMNYSGYLTSNNIKFTSTLSNLDYGANLNLLFEKNRITLGNIHLKNISKTKFPGQMTFSGDIVTNGLLLKSINIFMKGKLAVLSSFSRETSPHFYGDLVLETEKKWNYQYLDGKSSITGDVILNDVELNFVPSESSYSVTNSDFKYIFVTDPSVSDIEKEKKEKLLSAILLKKGKVNDGTIPSNFDLDITIKSPNISKLSVVLSKTLNQKLLADITGELHLKNLDNQFTSQGQFDILPSSMFTFYKTFNAEGTIKFTDDLTNPMIDLTSTYIADYFNPRDEEADPIKTAVKIKINDSVTSLLENLASGKKPLNMKLYTGQQNIDYDIPNPQYNDLDAMYFILFGTFSTDSEKANLATSAGMSVLGSTITTMLNARFGEAINNVNINQTGQQTLYNVSGRIQKVRYSIGGSLEEISDWSRTNAKLEYLFSPQFIIRVERKDPVISSSYNTDKINEFGVMYRFRF